MIEGVKINLFGEIRVWRAGQPIEGKEWDRQKTRSLLKLLLTRPAHVFSRDGIMEVLWPDASPTSAEPLGYRQLAMSGAQKLASTRRFRRPR
jgi:DNA-binding SARP family transcriptional activator